MKKSWSISRRTLLQTAGTAIGLPVLEAMISSDAQAAAKPPPQRILHYHAQIYGFVGRKDAELDVSVAPWTNAAPGYEVQIQNNTYMRPFFDKKIQSKTTILTGVIDLIMAGTHDSPVKAVGSTYPLAMRDGGCTILTAEPNADTKVGPLEQPDPYKGATADQIAALHIGKDTPIDSLTMAVQKVGGNFTKWPMSVKVGKEGIPPYMDPKEAFDRLFAGYDADATIEEIQRRTYYRQSVVDGVREDAARLKGRLGKSDQQKLDGYLDSVRSLEKQIELAGQGTPVSVTPPGTSDDYDTLELKQNAMLDLMVNAFITDRTRVIAYSGPFAGNWLKFRGSGQQNLDYSKFRQFTGAPLTDPHHTMSHYDQGDTEADIAKRKDHMEIYSHWTLETYAGLLAKLDSYMDIDGESTVLDNTVAIFGGDNADSARHGSLSMPCIIGGLGGGKIKAGRQLRFGAGGSSERTWSDLLWGALKIVGVPGLTTFGYATNALDDALGS